MKSVLLPKQLNYLLLVSLFVILFSCKKDDEEKPDVQNATITPEKRVEVVNNVTQFLNNLNWEDKSAAYQQIMQHLKTFKEIEEVGYSEEGDNVWARFTDGVDYIIMNNHPPGPEMPDPTAQILQQNERSSQNPNARVGVPESNKVYLINSLGTAYPSVRWGRKFIKGLFDNKGYDVEMVDGTIENLKNIKDAGVFYFSSHGGVVKRRDSVRVYSVYTSDSVTVQNEMKYKADYQAGYLTLISSYHNLDRYGEQKAETHYGITALFVEKYMYFPNNALMYLDICSSFRWPTFQHMFIKKSNYTGTYIGWTDNVVNADAYSTSAYFFDRILGANSIYAVTQPENPNQRSFDIPAVFGDMIRKDIGKSHASDKDPTRFAFLTYKGGLESTTFLRPSIAYLQMHEPTDNLYIYGTFGDDEGAENREVLVDGVPVEIEAWTQSLISCKIPRTGKGSAGDVVVKVREHVSHPRTLTEWWLVLKYKRPSEGSMMEEMTFNIHIRADVNKYRETAGTDPIVVPNTGMQALLAKDSKVTYSMGGSATHSFTLGCSHTTWSTWPDLKGEISFFDPMNPGDPMSERFMAQLEIKDKGLVIKNLMPGITKSTEAISRHRSVCDGVPTERESKQLVFFDNLPESFKTINLPFDKSFNLGGGRLSAEAPSRSGLLYGGEIINDVEPVFERTMEWSSTPAGFPPKKNAALRTSY